jgi:hypothetical protein
MNTSSNIATSQLAVPPPTSTTITPTPSSRLAAFFDILIRHAGAIAVDHTHMPPLDRVSGRTGLFNRPASRCCC